MTDGDRQRVRPYLGKAVIGTPGRVARMLAGSEPSYAAPRADRPWFRPELAGHVLVAVALDGLVYGWLWATDPAALTPQPTAPPQRGVESLWAAADHTAAPS